MASRRAGRAYGLVRVAGFLGVMLAAAPLGAQRPLNLDFETPSVAGPERPWGWSLGWSAFQPGPTASFGLDSVVRHGGRYSLRIALPDTARDTPARAIMLQVPSDSLVGRRLRLEGWMRVRGTASRAMATLEAWQHLAVAAADTAVAGAGGEWQRFALAITVPAGVGVHSVVVTAALAGDGEAWFDDFGLQRDGAPLAALPLTAAPPTRSELAWLRRQASPLETVAAGRGSGADLARVRAIVGEARIVALGETTHGTGEFFQLKDRLLRHLVEQAGFRVFAIEANQVAVERLNRYVQGGPGSAREAMRSLFAVWYTEEVHALVEWLRDHNARHPAAAVRFAGYDMQDQHTPGDSLLAFLERVEPAMAPLVGQLAGEYRAHPSPATFQVPDSTRARWHRQAEELWRRAALRRSAWLGAARSAPESLAVEWAVQSANLLRQAAMLNATQRSPDRDSLMAANLDWYLRVVAPGRRAVVWAHDVHVSRGGDPALSFNGGAQMGAHLGRWYGADYRAFSLLTATGTYRATRSFSDYTMLDAVAFPAPPGSVEAVFGALERPVGSVGWVVDLRPARSTPEGAFLQRPRPVRHVGYAAYDYGFEISAVLPLEFDAALFVAQTSPSRPLR